MLSKTVKHFKNKKNGRLVSYRKAIYLLLQTTIFFLLLTLNLTTATAQSFPVQVIPQVTPPPPIYFSEYANENTVNSPLRVQLILNDFEIVNREVRLRVSFEGSGISFQSKDLVTGASPLFLEGGVPLVLTNVELAPYFRYENLNGISGNVYGNAIPEGAYNFCFEVFDVLTGNRLSQKSCAISVVFQNEPPFLVSPRNKTNVEEINPQNIIFQWTPRHVNVSNVEYELSIVEIWDTQVDPQQAFLSSPPVFQTVTNATTYVYGPADPLFLSGKNYAWRVQAKAKQGLEEVGLFENQGYSEIYSFSYAGSCDLPFGINHEVKGSTNANIFWDDFSTDVPEYTLRYRQKNVEGAEWFTNKTSGNQTTLWDLKPGTVYEYQVQKQCAVTGSDWSITKQFTTFIADEEAAVYDCNITPNFNLSNKEPLANLYAGDAFKAGDFPIKVLETSGSNGRFTGKGYVTIPYLNSIRVGVAFTNVLVNTDNQLVEGSVVTVYDPSLRNILDIDEAVDTVTDAVDAVGEFVEGDNDLDEIKVNWAIDKDDIKIEDGKVVITNPQNGVTKSEPLGDDMVITDSEGKTYYVDAEGEITEGGTIDQNGAITGNNVEGVSNNGQLESLTAQGIQVTFNEEGTYGMDIMPTGNIGTLVQEYTVIKDADGKDYPLTHHAVKKGATTKVKATIDLKNGGYKADDVSFKTKQGDSIPTTFNGTTATLTLTGRYSFENEVIYATVTSKEDNSKQLTAGAFTLWHLTERSVNVALVSVNGASLGSIESNVSKIFEKAVANIQFGKSLSLSVEKSELGSNQTLDFGESAWAAAYNEEQKMLVNKVKQLAGYKSDTYYILVFNDIEPSRPIGGFMPLQRQMGFVFGGKPEKEDKGGDKSKTLAHEIGHGIFALQHPFSEFGTDEQQTDWLMDYGSGDQLPHTHWAQIHDPALKFYLFQEESDGLLIQNGITGYLNIDEENWTNYGFLSPIGTSIEIPEATHVKFNEDGAVIGFKIGEEKYLGLYNSESQRFIGYLNSNSSLITTSMVYTEEFKKNFEKERYSNIKFISGNKEILAIAKKRYKNSYLDCKLKAIWINNSQVKGYLGLANPPFIPETANILESEGTQCSNADGLVDGVGANVYFSLIDKAESENIDSLLTLSNHLSDILKNKTFSFYGYGLENHAMSNSMNVEVLNYLKSNNIFSKKKFEDHFPIQTFSRDRDVIFSTIDLRKTIPENYNTRESLDYVKLNATGERHPYNYSFSDLTVRLQYLADDTFIKTAIQKMEAEGRAEAISQKDGYDQYVAKYGTDAAFILWAEFSANSSKDLMTAYFAQRLVAQHGITIVSQISKEAGQKFIYGALEEALGNYLANKLLGEEQFSAEFFQDMILAGTKSVISPNKKIDFLFDCFINLDNDVINGLLKAKSVEEFEKHLLLGGFQCAFPALLSNKQDVITNYILKKNPIAKKAQVLFTNKFNIKGDLQTEFIQQVLGLDKVLAHKNEFYRQTLKKVLQTESGANAIDVLIRSGFDFTTLSARNLERLSSSISKYGMSDDLVNIFKGTTDVNRALIFLDNIVKSPQEYADFLIKIENNAMFSKTVTISGKTLKLGEFFNSSNDAYKYYHSLINDTHFYSKMDGMEGISIIINKTTNEIIEIIYGTSTNIFKDKGTEKLKQILDIE
ncbi:fibronectin type III domain protein [Flavobacteriaceae bacterium MAR_2009_75]|nr:fibronectin type III domain protein [Flavobacteriaceae bacterium MAR_2009_75]